MPHDREATLSALVRTLPYVRLFRGKTFVVKLGGSTTRDGAAVRAVVEQVGILISFGIRVVVVHGGGPQATALAARLGVENRFVDGRRVTSPAMLDTVILAIRGKVSTQILAECRRAHLPALGLSGVDAAILRAKVRPPVVREAGGESATVDYGEVGDLTSVDRDALERLLAAGFTPVLAPLAADDAGRVLNVNADTVASAVAVALGAEKLVFLTDTPGILENAKDPGSLVSYVDLPGLAALEARGALGGGMLPKVNAARAALAGGVPRVHVVGHASPGSLLAEVFTNEGAGTLIVHDRAEILPAELAQGAAPA
ncbi:MAG: acetylglutamate kinase [Deltaproteobacteria bacterium]|nr:acetylglutamate kinase [Deltaproteobacteria bacterium]